MIKAILTGLFCFVLFLAVHIAVFRTVELKRRFLCLTIIFFSILPAYALIYFLIPSGYMVLAPLGPVGKPVIPLELVFKLTAVINFSSGLMLYVFLFLGYCQFYFIVDRSISVRVMIEIERSSGKKLSFEEIKGVYSFDGILKRRLEHMVENKYIAEDSGRYSNTGKGRFEARLFSFVKDFLRLGQGG